MADKEKLVKKSLTESEKLAAIYEAAEKDLTNEINRALLRGNKTEYLVTMRNNCRKILKELKNEAADWTGSSIELIYQKGAALADELLDGKGLKSAIGYGTMHREAIKVLSEAVYTRLDDTHKTIGRRVDDIYRKLSLEAIRGNVVGFKSYESVARNLRIDLANHGVTSFTDKAKRRWNMTTYTRMVGRTTSMEAHVEGTCNRISERGHDLVKVTNHAGECDKCRPWEGRTLSISGNDPNYPSLADARAAGLFHPNCEHDIFIDLDLDAEIARMERELKE